MNEQWQIYLNYHQRIGILLLKKHVNLDKTSFATKQHMFIVFALDKFLCFSCSLLSTHDEAFLWHHIYITEQSHDSFTWRLKSMTYRYMTINYMKSSYMTLYLHEQHLHDGSLVWNPLIWLNYSFTWQMFTWLTLTWRFPSITWHSFA